MGIRAIETSYKGYRFRSRLEARWAVFFDALNQKWEYEKEGFELGMEGRYLPDFWLADHETWVEIKPQSVGYSMKCAYLTALTNQSTLLVYGNPWPGEYGVDLYWPRDEGGKPYYSSSCNFATGRRNAKEVWIVNDGRAICLNAITDDKRFPLSDSVEIMYAYSEARSARFEHGENPRITA